MVIIINIIHRIHMKVLVCGSREYDNWTRVKFELDSLLKKPTVIIHGAAPGVDTMAGIWARNNDVTEESYPADWETHGKAAGPIRNQKMLDEGKPNYVIAFVTENSKGTRDMIKKAEKAGVPVIIHDV
jgi:hypothetical protein